MHNSQIFIPANIKNNLPLVIALPGIVAGDEPTRINSILEDLSTNYGIMGIRLNYVEKEEIRGCIAYKFNIHDSALNIENTIEKALEELPIDSNRIGIISNSISAFPATKYLINYQKSNKKARIRCYTSISPLLGWQYFLNREIREYLEKEKIDILLNECNRGKDTKNKIIPREMIPQLIKMDAIADLESYIPNGVEIRTILGSKDRKADPKSMRKYHFRLGGKSEDLIVLDTDHDVPDSNNYVISFMVQHLNG